MSWSDWLEYEELPHPATDEPVPFLAQAHTTAGLNELRQANPFESVTEQIDRVLEDLPLLQGDLRHIEQHMKRTAGAKRADLLETYHETWQQTTAAEPSPIRKDNVGRRAANLWLLEQGEQRT